VQLGLTLGRLRLGGKEEGMRRAFRGDAPLTIRHPPSAIRFFLTRITV